MTTSYLDIATRALAELRQAGCTTGGEPGSGVRDAEGVSAMALADFATAGLRLVVNSEVLGERVVFASDNAPKRETDSGMVEYRAAELRELLGLSPEELRRVHLVKKTFGGKVLPEGEVR